MPKTSPRELSLPTAKVLATGTSNQQFPTQFFIAESHAITSPLPPWFFCIFWLCVTSGNPDKLGLLFLVLCSGDGGFPVFRLRGKSDLSGFQSFKVMSSSARHCWTSSRACCPQVLLSSKAEVFKLVEILYLIIRSNCFSYRCPLQLLKMCCWCVKKTSLKRTSREKFSGIQFCRLKNIW